MRGSRGGEVIEAGFFLPQPLGRRRGAHLQVDQGLDDPLAQRLQQLPEAMHQTGVDGGLVAALLAQVGQGGQVLIENRQQAQKHPQDLLGAVGIGLVDGVAVLVQDPLEDRVERLVAGPGSRWRGPWRWRASISVKRIKSSRVSWTGWQARYCRSS